MSEHQTGFDRTRQNHQDLQSGLQGSDGIRKYY